ncbi:hypothetical protein CAPTEDRAFT_188840 [Capitella teleta]|uniref:Cadherin domain-containing protein n=1 Tax=Capitella teleta TaxID=283909 RepID=R7T7Q1_CAPTE|nr:hypothetical protein CAPTEDRAFT_188840 [Capitella teleta]|eukprot:ELT89458.1 hypothetical protein CAPTEDRAFT_188840 [Capitella teleta]
MPRRKLKDNTKKEFPVNYIILRGFGLESEELTAQLFCLYQVLKWLSEKVEWVLNLFSSIDVKRPSGHTAMNEYVTALLLVLRCTTVLYCDAGMSHMLNKHIYAHDKLGNDIEQRASSPNCSSQHPGAVATKWSFGCCGVISTWEVKAAASGEVQLQVWDVFDEIDRQAMMVGANDVKVDVSAGESVRFDIDVADQIPVRPGNAIGWRSFTSDTIYYSEGCDTCTLDYFLEDLTTKTPDTYALWETHQFKGSGQSIGQSREYAVKAHVHQGAIPTMPNVPSITMVLHSDYIGFPFFFVDYWDDNEMDEVSVSLVSVQPDTQIFDVHGASGRIRAMSSLASAEPEYTLTLEVTDGCLSSRADLIIKVRLPPVEGICNQGTEYGILDMALSPMITDASVRTAVLVTHPYWQFDCCGVISSYEIVVAEEGDIELQIWQVTDIDQRMAEMIGFSSHHVVPDGDNPVIVEVAEEDRIQLKEGYAIGWLSRGSKDLVKYAEACDSCTLDYFIEEVRPNMRPIFYNPGLEHSFASEGYVVDKERAYAVRAIVEPGPLPRFENLPDSITVEYDAKVGDLIYALEYTKTNAVKLSPTSGASNRFTLDSSNGRLELAEEFVEEDDSFDVSFEISDGCQSSTATLKIEVTRPPQKGVCYPKDEIGTSDINIQSEIDTASRSAYVVTDMKWTIDCNGILTGWELRVGEDCDIELQVWGDVDLLAKRARLKSTSTHHVPKSDSEPHVIELPRDQQVPITKGDVIGWYLQYVRYTGKMSMFFVSPKRRLGGKKDTLLHSEGCRSCTNSYLVEAVGLFSPFAPGDLFTFSNDGYDIGISKDFAIKAVVSSGSAPQFTGMPTTVDVILSILDNSSSSALLTVQAVDDDINDVISYSLVSISPQADIFALNSSSGVLTIEAGAYASAAYELDIRGTDGAYSTLYKLRVRLEGDEQDDDEDDVTKEPIGAPSAGFFQTLPGYIVLGVVGLLVMGAIVAGIAVCLVKNKKSRAKESKKYIQREPSTMTDVVVNDSKFATAPANQTAPPDQPEMQREMTVLPPERASPTPLIVKPTAVHA